MKKFTYILSIIASFAIIGCGGSSSNSSSSKEYKGFGSMWTVTLNSNNTFNITRKTSSSASVDLDVDGTYTSINSTKFLDMLVTQENIDTNNIVSVNDPAVAIEVPNFGLYLHAINQNAFVAMSNATTCPTSTTVYNYLPLDSTSNFIGVATYDPVNNTLTSTEYDNNGNVINTNSATNVNCNSGVISFTLNGDSFEGYISTSGAFTTKNLNSGNIFYGVERSNISSVSSLNGSYSGMHFSYPLSSPSNMTYMKLVTNNGTFTADAIDKNDNIQSSMGSASYSIPSNLPTGFIQSSTGVTCAVGLNINPNKNLILCKESGTNYVFYQR